MVVADPVDIGMSDIREERARFVPCGTSEEMGSILNGIGREFPTPCFHPLSTMRRCRCHSICGGLVFVRPTHSKVPEVGKFVVTKHLEMPTHHLLGEGILTRQSLLRVP